MASRKDSRKVDSSNEPDGALTDWAKALESVVEPTDVVPEGFYTVVELADQLHLSISSVRRKIYMMRKEGKVEVKRFRRQGPAKVYPVDHYKILE